MANYKNIVTGKVDAVGGRMYYASCTVFNKPLPFGMECVYAHTKSDMLGLFRKYDAKRGIITKFRHRFHGTIYLEELSNNIKYQQVRRMCSR